MRIPALDRATAGDDLRPALSSVWVGKEETVATNAHILVVHKTKALFGEEFASSLPEEGIRLSDRIIRDIRKKDVMAVRLSEDKTMITLLPDPLDVYSCPTIGYKLPKNIPAMPDYKKVIPKKEESRPIDAIKFNTRLIDNLSKALLPGTGKGFVVFHFRSNNTGCLVIPENVEDGYEDSYAVIMPAML